MPDLIHVHYATTGESTSINPLGMREMQARAYVARDAQYLPLKAPPAASHGHGALRLSKLTDGLAEFGGRLNR